MAEATYEKECELEVIFHDGEGLTHGDLNDVSERLRNYTTNMLIDYLWARPGTTVVTPTGANKLRPLDGAMQTEVTGSGLEVQVLPGLVIDDFVSDMILAEMETAQAITPDAADGSLDRIDTLSAKVELLTGDSSSRDFKDATTGALSSSALNKRNRAKMTIRYKPGTPAGSPTAPAIPSDEGKLCEIYIAAAATTITDDEITDFRWPWGFWKRNIPPHLLWGGGAYTTANWEFSAASQVATASLDSLRRAYRPVYLGDYDGTKMSNLRIAEVRLMGQITSPGTVQIRARDYGDASGAAATYSGINISTGLVTGTAGHHYAGLETTPAWVNGLKNPRFLGGLVEPLGEIFFTSGDAADFIRGVTVTGYGIP